MNIQFTSEALQKLQPYIDDKDTLMKLVYDADGCGCAVSGVPALWVLNKQQVKEEVRNASHEPLQIVYEPRHEVFFEDRLKLDYHSDKRAFKLSSDGQIYSTDLAIVDKRGE